MSAETGGILTNREVIAVNQDPLGIQGRRVRKTGDLEVWAKKLSGNSHAVILFNRGKDDQSIAVSWHEIGLRPDAEPGVRDLWTAKNLGQVKGTFTARVPPHDVVMIRVTPSQWGANCMAPRWDQWQLVGYSAIEDMWRRPLFVSAGFPDRDFRGSDASTYLKIQGEEGGRTPRRGP